MEAKDFDLSSLKIDRSAELKEPSNKSRRGLKIVLILALLGLLLLGGLALTRLLEPRIEVQLATATYTSRAQASAVLSASGYVVAQRKAAVASKATGRLIYLGVEEGDQVKKGQVIARLEDQDVLAALEQARANLRLSESDLDDARQSFKRQKILLEKQFIAQADVDAAEARYKRVVASIEAARAAVAEAEVAVENTRIVAPFDGTVLTKNADVGEILAPMAAAASSKAAVVTIADLSSLEVEADVSESNITLVLSKQPCEIVLDAYPEQRYSGFVSKIVPTADRAKATVQVKVKFKSYDKRVLPEMSAKITFLSPGMAAADFSGKPVLTVPFSAVSSRNGRQVIYAVLKERAVEVPVVLGERLGTLVEIRQGLRAGDKIIARVDDRVAAGAKVVVK
ncbi:MAG: efflux RND transporter periplasmic adaptor subunit [Deltaproteobacteria bacterium]|nr:efflux RND transporter periplasmic adaptor subunit [Deltaproteobacteria bacterium]